MRSGLLLLGVMLLIAGLIFYTIPTTIQAAPENAQEAASGAALQRQTSLAAMILGALLTLLGLVLPDAHPTMEKQRVETARTTAAPARRVIYTRDAEEREKR